VLGAIEGARAERVRSRHRGSLGRRDWKLLPKCDRFLTELSPDGTIALSEPVRRDGPPLGGNHDLTSRPKAVIGMAMQMWLTRPWEFEQLDQAINNRCCDDNLHELESWVETLDAVVAGQPIPGIGASTGVFPGQGQSHFYKHWVGDYANGFPPDYWPYAWGRSTGSPPTATDPPSAWLRIERLMSFGLAWSIRKVVGARRMVDDRNPGPWDRPRCSDCRTHTTVWVCFEVSEADKRLAEANVAARKSLFRIGVIESRDAVTLVVKTPRPIELTAGVCDPTKETAGGEEDEKLYREPVIVTEAFTSDDDPRWTQPTTTASSVTAAATIHDVVQQPLPEDGHMPEGTFPDETAVETCKFVSMPTTEEIKEKLRAATREDGPGRLDLSEELINRLRIGIADE